MKSYADCKKEVAKKYGFGNLVMGHLVKYYDEAAEMYAKECVEHSQKTTTPDDIKRLFEEYKKEHLPNASEPFHHEAEIAAGFKYFLLWMERKVAVSNGEMILPERCLNEDAISKGWTTRCFNQNMCQLCLQKPLIVG